MALQPLLVREGKLPVADLMVDPSALQRTRADDQVAGWWLQRLHRVSALVPEWPGSVKEQM